MENKLIKKSLSLAKSILASYSQIFFTENRILASILFFVSFIDWWIGICGLIAVLTSILLAQLLEYSSISIEKGLYSFNSLLVGLGIGTYFSIGIEVVFLVAIGSSLSFFTAVLLIGFLEKYKLPFLSIPFLIAMWLSLLAFPAFSGIELNSDMLYPSNMFYKLGGNTLVTIIENLTNFFEPFGFTTYFLSLGAIFFQFNILAGIFIAIGLLIHSRVNFIFSLIGFFVAYWFYSFLGIYTGSLNYTYYGFNFILSAIAIGGYFVIPSRQSLLWSLLLIPILVVVTVGSDRLFAIFELSVFSLPFNIVVIGTLYAFKIRLDQTKSPVLTISQQKNPETNAYYYNSQPVKKFASYLLPINLPFIGQWVINQGHKGKYTHKNFYKYAWDFIIKDSVSGKEFRNEGLSFNDYFCFDKPVISPAKGTIVAIENSVEDNEIGVSNTLQNWGNTIVIKHSEFLFSKLSHLKKESIEVQVGDYIQDGQIIAKCGNSGRSAYPHLHFQLQSTPKISGSTVFYPLFEYLQSSNSESNFIQKGIPKENFPVENIQTSSILQSAFKWNPGDKFSLNIESNDKNAFSIVNEVDIYNNSFLHCQTTDAKMYYFNNGKSFSVVDFKGSKKSPLYYLYFALYKVILSNSENLMVETRFPVFHLYRFPLLTLQDFFVPIGIFLKGKYQLKNKGTNQSINIKELVLNSQIIGKINKILYSSKIIVHKNREIELWCETNNNIKTHLKWKSILD